MARRAGKHAGIVLLASLASLRNCVSSRSVPRIRASWRRSAPPLARCHTEVMAERVPPPLTVVRPGEGRAGDLGAITVEFKLMGADTGGALAIVEHGFPPGSLVPPHVHTLEDEYSIVTAGEIGFRSGDREVVLGAGGYITKPRGEAHAMWNAGPQPARMIEVISPAGFELFFRAVVDLLEAGDADPGAGARLAAEHGLSFVDTPWLADVVRRFDLNA
jgi:quercetin dioxygenase-like cupin family protein